MFGHRIITLFSLPAGTEMFHFPAFPPTSLYIQLGPELTGPHPQGWVLNKKAAMRVFVAELTLGEPHPLQDHSELRWLPLGSDHNASAVLSLEWIPADYPIVEALLAAVHAVG